MAIEVHEITEKKTWQDFIAAHGTWSFFQSFQWGELQKQLGVPVVRLGLYDNDTLVAVAQLFVIKARRGIFLWIRQGPVFANIPIEKKYWESFIEQFKHTAKVYKATFVRLSPMIEESQDHQNICADFQLRPSPIHAMDGEICWVLDLKPTGEELLAGMRKTTRYLVRQGQKMGITVEKSSDIAAFLRLYEETAQRHEFVQHRGIREEYELFSQAGMGQLYVAKHEGHLIAGALIIYFGKMAIYHHGASLPSKIPGSYVLQWQAIQDAKKRGMELYNFWGIALDGNKRHPWRGLTLFKQGFGGRTMQFLHAHDLALSPFYAISYTIETIRRLKKGY